MKRLCLDKNQPLRSNAGVFTPLSVYVSANETNSEVRFELICSYLEEHSDIYRTPELVSNIPLDVRVVGLGRDGGEETVDFDFKERDDWGQSVLGKNRHAARQLIKAVVEGNPSFFAVLASDKEVFDSLQKSAKFTKTGMESVITGMRRIRHFKAVSYGSFNVPVFNFDYDGIGSAFSTAKSIIRTPNIVSLFPNAQDEMLLGAMLSFVPGLGPETIELITDKYPSVADFILRTGMKPGAFSDERFDSRRVGIRGYKALEMLGVINVKEILADLGWIRR